MIQSEGDEKNRSFPKEGYCFMRSQPVQSQLSLARFVQLLFVTEREQIVLQIKTSTLLGLIYVESVARDWI